MPLVHASQLLYLWLGLVLSAASSTVLAADSKLSWAEAVQETAQNNAELKAAYENIQATQLAVKVARANYLPQVQASMSSSLNGRPGDADLSSNFGVLAEGQRSYGASISATQSIFNGFANQAREAQAEIQVEQSQLQLRLLKARLSAELKSTFASMLLAQKSQKLYQVIASRRQDNLKLVQLRFASGIENKGAVQLSAAYFKEAQLQELGAKHDLMSARARLNKVLGRNDDTGKYELSGEITAGEPEKQPDLHALALASPQHQLSLREEKSAQNELRSSEAGFYPDLSLSANLGRGGFDFFPKEEQWSLTLSFSYPLFTGGRDAASRQAAIHKLTASSLNRQHGLRDILAKLQAAHTNFIEAIIRLEIDQNFQSAATLRAEIARSKYNNGLASFEDWDLIENDLISRERAVLSSQNSKVIAEATWEETQGRGVLP